MVSREDILRAQAEVTGAMPPDGWRSASVENGRVRVRIAVDDLWVEEPQMRSAADLVPPPEPAPVSSQWGLPADSPVVTGNLGMFYRDGHGQTQPYTWGEILDNIARRVRAHEQPALVRAKYGVGFALPGGDMPERAFDPEHRVEPARFSYAEIDEVRVAAALVTGPLDLDETLDSQRRLAALIQRGEDTPTERLPPESAAALHHLGLLPASALESDLSHPEARAALRAFRDLVGKAEPDDPAHCDLLLPAERVALELYDLRIARYAAMQAAQRASLAQAPDLSRIQTLPSGLQRMAAPRLLPLQTALAERGLLNQPIQKRVWRDKKNKRRVSYKTVPFSGMVDVATIAALDRFQWRNGLLETAGRLDAETLGRLGLPALGAEIVLPLAGPHCELETARATPPASRRHEPTPSLEEILRLSQRSQREPSLILVRLRSVDPGDAPEAACAPTTPTAGAHWDAGCGDHAG